MSKEETLTLSTEGTIPVSPIRVIDPEDPTAITLPDGAPLVEQVSPTDRLLAFDETGDPVITTAEQVKDYTQKQIPYVGENLLSNTFQHSGQWYWFSSEQAMPVMRSIEVGKTYTISADVLAVQGTGFNIVLAPQYNASENVQYVMPIGTDSVGKRIAVTFTASNTYPAGAIACGMGSNVNGGTLANVKLEQGAKATPYVPNPADIARALPFSLTEQLVPGEFWRDSATGEVKQVYIRSFVGMISSSVVETIITSASYSFACTITF